MSDTLGPLMERNLLDVFGQRDSARRAAAIAELYIADCTFFEVEEQVTGREALTPDRSGRYVPAATEVQQNRSIASSARVRSAAR